MKPHCQAIHDKANTPANPQFYTPFAHPLARLFEYMPDIYYFVKNRQSQFVDANTRFVEMLGARQLEEILGKTDHDFSPRELANRFIKDDRLVLETGLPITDRVELVPNADGTISWHVTSKVPLHDSTGQIIGLAGFTRDLHKANISLKRYGAMTPVIDHIAKHYAEPVTVHDLAVLLHLSVSQFERRFKNVFSLTPMQYLVKYRVNIACRLLVGDDQKVTDIATTCGFYDHSHFIRQFTKVLGIAPHEYRKRHT